MWSLRKFSPCLSVFPLSLSPPPFPCPFLSLIPLSVIPSVSSLFLDFPFLSIPCSIRFSPPTSHPHLFLSLSLRLSILSLFVPHCLLSSSPVCVCVCVCVCVGVCVCVCVCVSVCGLLAG